MLKHARGKLTGSADRRTDPRVGCPNTGMRDLCSTAHTSRAPYYYTIQLTLICNICRLIQYLCYCPYDSPYLHTYVRSRYLFK